MKSYWEDRREREEKEARDKELNQIVKFNWDEEAEEYDKIKKRGH